MPLSTSAGRLHPHHPQTSQRAAHLRRHAACRTNPNYLTPRDTTSMLRYSSACCLPTCAAMLLAVM